MIYFFFLIFWHTPISPSTGMPPYRHNYSPIIFSRRLHFINLISLTKKLLWLEKKLKTICFTKKFFLIVTYIHCFECIFYHQIKTKKSFSFHRFLSYDRFLFESCLSNVQQNINKTYFSSLWLIVWKTFLVAPFAVLCSLLSFTKYKYLFGFNPTNSSIATPAVSSFVLPTINLFELS